MTTVYSHDLDKGHFQVHLSKPSLDFLHAHQVHGTDIVSPETLPAEADGIMVSWDDLNIPLAIKTADCLPIVIEGEKGVVFLHAGWRGLAQGILKKPEVSLISPTRVLIGPSIQKCCFEVSSEFRDHFPHSSHFSERAGQLYFDLQEEAKTQLHALFPTLIVEFAPLCTSCDLTLHSYRRNKTQERNWNLYIKG
jgi:polyphenol oxidase